MDVRVLRYFIAVATEKSISSAAQSLHLSQPTLSKQLKELEEELGTSLFLRGNRGITLTDEGNYLLKKAKEIIELVDRTEKNFNEPEGDISGEIFIGCGETEGMRFVARSLKKLQEKYPAIHIHLHSGNADDISAKLENGLLDFGIFIDPTDKNKYEYIKLPYKDQWGVLMRKDVPLAEKESIKPQDLFDKLLLVSRQSTVNNEISGWLGKNIEDVSVIATYNLIYNASLMVEEGFGYALCLDRLVNTTGDSELCFRPFDPPLEVNLNIAWKKNQAFSAASNKFLEQLRRDITGDN
ncbi:LysR family transcriptional regulator [Desemzia sp. RIT804]|uniref:LysR family transcriptional regulator n=1 Tax=Desemzia sp. RIT 804 TaxID=2810209 RepID=UPI001950BE2D|nr:LysR family transcriptional regulator [Desemzia sp. RIT 804]MBM6614871.1 LysR family transcriptional regulator [Desemzia sp. RIT 804]